MKTLEMTPATWPQPNGNSWVAIATRTFSAAASAWARFVRGILAVAFLAASEERLPPA